MEMTEPRKLLIVATGRAGTKWSARAWQKMGLDVGHEYVGKHGSVTRFFAVDGTDHPSFPNESPKNRMAHQGERRSDFEFEHIWHQVRHPLTCITSLSLAFPRSAFEWYSRYIDINPKHPDIRFTAMQFWLKWNELCAEHATMSFQIEEIDHYWSHMCEELGVPVCEPPSIDRTLNRSKRWSRPFVDRKAIQAAPDLTWEDLSDIDPILAIHVEQAAKAYGYSTED